MKLPCDNDDPFYVIDEILSAHPIAREEQWKQLGSYIAWHEAGENTFYDLEEGSRFGTSPQQPNENTLICDDFNIHILCDTDTLWSNGGWYYVSNNEPTGEIASSSFDQLLVSYMSSEVIAGIDFDHLRTEELQDIVTRTGKSMTVTVGHNSTKATINLTNGKRVIIQDDPMGSTRVTIG